MRYVVTGTTAVGPHEVPDCGHWSMWRRRETLPLVTTVEGRDSANPKSPPLIVVRYHHAPLGNHGVFSVDATLRRAMAQLVALKNAFGVREPAVVRVDHWAYTDERRLPSAKGEPVGPQHVNGGCTASGGGDVITCYRQEEYPKVWLHEGVHCFGLDFGDAPPVRGLGPLSGLGLGTALGLPIRTERPVLVNEAWTELLAEAFATAFATGANVGTRRWNDAWRRETGHALLQSAHLLRHNGYSRAAELFDGTRAWRERTNALAYYVLRAALMPRPGEWIHPVASGKSRYDEFIRMLNGRLASPAFRDGLQRAMDKTDKHKRGISLRMMSSE